MWRLIYIDYVTVELSDMDYLKKDLLVRLTKKSDRLCKKIILSQFFSLNIVVLLGLSKNYQFNQDGKLLYYTVHRQAWPNPLHSGYL